MDRRQKKALAHNIGIALGDGNLSNSNGRAIRLRITCDAKYPKVAEEIMEGLKIALPKNKISIVRVPGKDTFFNISIYSNKFAKWMPWKVGMGSKLKQSPRIPLWIRKDRVLAKECIRGLLQTDGCIYKDRGYQMVNFVNYVEPLARDVEVILKEFGFRPTFSRLPVRNHFKYTVRVARDTHKLIKTLHLYKA